MKSKLINAFLIGLVLITVAECKKKSSPAAEEEPPAATTPANSINTIAEVFATNGVQPQTTNVSATAAQVFTVSGVKIEVPANAFKTASGGTVTGTVDLTIKGILTKKDIILTGAPANGSSSNKLISTKGCIKVSASQNGQTLRLTSGQNFYVDVMETGTLPTSTARKFIAPKVSTADSTLCWKPDPDSLNIPTYLDTLAGKYYYRARIDSANWLNVGQKWDTTATKTAVTVTLASTFNKTNAAVYISLNGIMVVGNLYEISPNVFRISNIPVGRAVNLVAIAVINGQYYSSIVSTTTTTGFSQSIALQPTTLSAIQSALTALP